jgi:branched-chain amino acid transport system substrate-binding protein
LPTGPSNKMGWKTAYALLDTFIEYDKSECRGFVARFKELNGDQSVVLKDTFKNGDVSVATQISAIRHCRRSLRS